MQNNPPFQYNYNAQNQGQEEQKQASNSWFSAAAPSLGKLWGSTSSVLK
jgi:hypothetical protein